MINRGALFVRARQPFINWLRSLPDPVDSKVDLAYINREPGVYLVPVWEDDEERDMRVEDASATIFETELEGWWTDDRHWPEDRDYETFQKWFEVTACPIVEDLVDEPLFEED